MNNLFKKQSAKFVQNPSRFTKVMAKHILVCFYAPQCRRKTRKKRCYDIISKTTWRLHCVEWTQYSIRPKRSAICNRCFLSPPESLTKTASLSLQPFFAGPTRWQTEHHIQPFCYVFGSWTSNLASFHEHHNPGHKCTEHLSTPCSFCKSFQNTGTQFISRTVTCAEDVY